MFLYLALVLRGVGDRPFTEDPIKWLFGSGKIRSIAGCGGEVAGALPSIKLLQNQHPYVVVSCCRERTRFSQPFDRVRLAVAKIVVANEASLEFDASCLSIGSQI